MLLSQKCQYALRAIFEVAKRSGQGPVKIEVIAKSQAIPPRFLAAILNQLKTGGFVMSKRGAEGGYFLSRSPDSLSAGEIIRFIEGPVAPVECIKEEDAACPLRKRCVFMPMWKEAQRATEAVYDNTSFQDLMDQEASILAETQDSAVMYHI